MPASQTSKRNNRDMSKLPLILKTFDRVYMRCVTWGRDSHGLFDYESRQIAKRNIKSYTGGKIIRLNNDVEFISRQSSAGEYGPEAKPLIIVHEKNGKFLVENDTLVPMDG